MRHLTASQKIAHLESRIARLEKKAHPLRYLKDIEKVFEDEGYKVEQINLKNSYSHGGYYVKYELTDSQGREADMQVEVIGRNDPSFSIRVDWLQLTYASNPKRVARELKRELQNKTNVRRLDGIFI
jgi:hypothetical protein